MNSKTQSKTRSRTPDEITQLVSNMAGAVVAGVGLVVLLGWTLGLESLKGVLPGLATMKASTALCFLLAGVALVLRDRREVRLICAGLVSTVSGLTLAEYATGVDFGLDQLLFRDALNQNAIYPGRMSQATALGFLLSGASLLLLKVQTRTALHLYNVLALATAIVGAAAVLGYAYDVEQLYRFYGYSSMALHTAVSLIVLAAGLIFVRSDGLSTVLITPGPGTQLSRRLLPAAIFGPAVFGWLIHSGHVRGFYGEGMDTALFVLLMALTLGGTVWWNAQELNRADSVRRGTEAELRNLTEMMDHAHEPLIVREPSGVIRAWNRGAAALYGWPAADALGRHKQTLLRTEGESGEEIDRQFENTGHWEGELVQTTRDGRRVTVESRQTARHTEDGQLLILESNLDITERKRTEEALRLSEERYRGLVEQAPVGIFVIDAQGRYLDVNSAGAQMLGYTREEIYRMGFADVLAPEEMARLPEAVARLAGGTVNRNEWRFKRKDGSFFIGEVVGRQLPDGLFQGILRDMTAHKQTEAMLRNMNEVLELRVVERTRELASSMELLRVETTERIQTMEALREKEQMLIQQSRQAAMGEMISNIAHQWRQPLNTLGLMIQKLKLFYDLGKFNEEFLNNSVNKSMEVIHHMSKTIDDFRNFFKPDKEKTAFKVLEIIETTLSLLEGALKNPFIEVEIIAKNDLVITGFQNEFAQVILNILINARDVFIERVISNPKVTIKICNEDGCVVVTVADNAGGIPEDIINKVFDPYFSTKGPQQGTGVGLFMSKSIIEKNMGGRLTVRNTANGAEFRIEVDNGSFT